MVEYVKVIQRRNIIEHFENDDYYKPIKNRGKEDHWYFRDDSLKNVKEFVYQINPNPCKSFYFSGNPSSNSGDYFGFCDYDVNRNVSPGAARCVPVDNLEDNLYRLSLQISSGDVQVGNYTYFKIYDPKLRTICAASFPERVLHHALMNVCHSVFERHFIYTTYATRPGKGVYAALNRAFDGINTCEYVGKFDVRHYFDTIDHQLLKEKIARLFKDKVLLKIFFAIIDSYSVADGKGLPIGNLTSQYFANYYLSSFDHWCKEVLKVREYVRYMDDLILIHHSKEYLEECWKILDTKLAEIELKIHPKKTNIHKVTDNTPFLGFNYRLTNTGKVLMLMRKSYIKRQKRHLKGLVRAYGKGRRFV